MFKKTCLITGSTSGLGKSLSIKLAAEGFKLVLVSRSKKKLKKLSTLIGSNNSIYFALDLTNKNQVKNLIKKIPPIDILINNAGGFYLKKKNIKFIEKTMMLNYYTPYLLIRNLILKNKFKQKKVLNIITHALPKNKICISNLSDLKKLNGWKLYKISKLLMITMTHYLNKHYPNHKFINVDPGRMKTNFGSNDVIFIRFLIKIYLYIFGKDPNNVANNIVKKIKQNPKNVDIGVSKNKIKLNYIFNEKFQKKLIKHSNKVINYHE
jgi:short-subunit dehydrogenase